MKKLWNMIVNLVKDFFNHWKAPGEGKYISNKELVAYSIGGMGVQFLAAVNGLITLGASCLLLGSIYSIKPTAFATILLINTVFTIVIQPFKAWLIDKVNTKQGKIKPWILWLGLPSAVLMVSFAFLPFNSMSNMQLTVVVGVLFILMNFIYQFFLAMYNQLPQLMTPNTEERAVVYSFSSIVCSMAPTITTAAFPLIADLFEKQWFDINFFRTIFPIASIIGVALSLLVYFGTKERVIVPKNYDNEVKFWDGMKEVFKNKYVWVINIATVFIFARDALIGVQTWMYTYMLQNNVVYSILSVIVGTASLFGMVLAPIMCKKLGKRNTTIISDAAIGIASLFAIFFANSVVTLFIALYVSFFGRAIQIITLPALNGDMLDHLQWKTGKRLEGMVGNFTIITSIIAIGTNYIIPYINEYFGLIDDYNVLYDVSLRTPMFRVLAVLGLVGSILHALAYVPWDLTEKRHEEIMEELKERAKKANEEAGFKNASILSSGENLEAALVSDAVNDIVEGDSIIETSNNENVISDNVDEKVENEIEQEGGDQ